MLRWVAWFCRCCRVSSGWFPIYRVFHDL